MQPFPVSPQFSLHPLVRGSSQWNQAAESQHPYGDIRSLDNFFQYVAEVQFQQKDTVGCEMQAGIEKNKQADHPSQENKVQVKNLNGLRICVVNDNEPNQLLLLHHMTEWGMIWTGIYNEKTMLERLRKMVAQGEPCDLLVVDRQIHEIDGFTLARWVKADPILSNIRIIMLTTLGQRGDASVAREAGIAGYLTKPIHQDQLRDCLLTVINGSGTADPQLVTKHTLREGRQRKGGKLLVAEDNIVNQKVAVRMLERLGYRIDIVADGKEAVEAVSRISYDAVLMDCQMPEMDGYEATQEIRRREASSVKRDETDSDMPHVLQVTDDASRIPPHIPIIAITANAMKGDREKCLAAGMDDFVSKPVKPEELEAALERWVPKRKTETREGLSGKREAENRDAPVGNNEIPDTRDERRNTSDEQQGPPLDPATLDSLRELSGDDPSFLIEVIQQFLHDGPAHVAAIRQSVVDGDAESLLKTAHTLKGSCRNMGALPLGELCFTMEQKGQAGETANLDDLLALLENEYKRVQLALDAKLARFSVGSDL